MSGGMTEASVQAIYNLRRTDHFEWYLIPLFAFVVYVYMVEVERKSWNILAAGLAYYGLELFWEMLNALLLAFTGRSALWTTPGDSAYLIFVGLTIEISMMFAVAPVIFAKALSSDRSSRVLGIPNRLFCVLAFGFLGLFVETLLNRWGVLIWEYSFWQWPNLGLLCIAYCMSFWFVALVHDMKSMRAKVALTCGIYVVDAISVIVFVHVLDWI